MSGMDLSAPRHGCADCGLHEFCLPAGADADALARLDRLTRRQQRNLARGETLFRQGQPFQSLFVLRSGAVRTAVVDADGAHQVIGFGLPGEVIGIDGLLDDRHRTEAVALESSTFCEVPFERMEDVLEEVPTLQRGLMRVLGREVAAEQEHAVAMGRQQAVARVALFLRGMVERHGRLSRQADFLKLPMPRSDIANYLGLAVETVSRALGRMEDEGILSVSGRSVRILRHDALAALCRSADADASI
ncbi:MAG: Transcriptional activator protein Anr [Luteibacter sp.]|uniref:cyclic nucleotide-binding domain-containing protein n=1 Tax=Luteibacter sp. TaxID=1886636 RepID=UPI0013818259|nr:cyclic nucleotide-binding domain-containing protein [Luteibacter sp.]KAF1009178.1 MAG: Transcriptional activator protein Anr [Luteibacter sp.]